MKLGKATEILKALVPHVFILFVLLLYIAGGASFFRLYEGRLERNLIDGKVRLLQNAYGRVADNFTQLCRLDWDSFKGEMDDSLLQISTIHDQIYAAVEPLEIIGNTTRQYNVRWTYSSAILYALGVITTTGYSYVQLNGSVGEIFAIAYGLVGLPLLFLTAADIGKLMSELVTLSHGKWLQRRRLATAPNAQQDNNEVTKVLKRIGELEKEEKVTLPAGLILLMALLVCTLGSFMYVWHEGWTFIDALYFTSNAVSNVTLGDRPNSGWRMAVMTVFYVIFGLAVVTMSIDLAQNQLRGLFAKLHFFGRIRNFLTIDEDVKKVLAIFKAVRKKKNRDGPITTEDLLEFFYRQDKGDRGGTTGESSDESADDDPLLGRKKSRKNRQKSAFDPTHRGSFVFADEDKSVSVSIDSFSSDT